MEFTAGREKCVICWHNVCCITPLILFFQDIPVLVSSNVTMQFGSKPLFENISVKFGGGNRYGLIGANGSGKSTFMKILLSLIHI